MQNLTLNDLYGSYTSNRLNKRQFEEALFKNIIHNYERFFPYRRQKEDYIDYLCWLYPRITRAIDHYRDTGSSFEAYIYTMLHWSVREWKSRKKEIRMLEYAAWMGLTADSEEAGTHEEPEVTLPCAIPGRRETFPENEVHSREPDYPDRGEPLRITNPRQILILILKSYYFISEDFLERAAPLIGVKKEKLREMIDTLRERRLKRDDEIHSLQERIRSQFFRCIVYERRMLSLPENQIEFDRLKTRLQKARYRLESMRKRLSRIRTEATNLQVAEVLGVPKGTIDSSLYALRNRMGQGKKKKNPPQTVNEPPRSRARTGGSTGY
ncbi:MAG: hypothetical protein LBG42_00235 [Treponema sp.]|jgi:DNA-directed RNA polymerase specialized sigma24 family protein|nr:hypothetical protein [Treponema sp.]